MKTRLIFLVLLIVCFSCGTNKKPVSDAQKEKIKGEVKEIVNTAIKGAEEANFDMTLGQTLNSPDFVYIINGKTFTYKEFMDGYKTIFSTLQNQKGTILDEKYAVLDNSTVTYTANSKWLMNFKDGHSVLQDPWIVQWIFKKIDNKWKIISGTESGVEKSVANAETSKELNQVELFKQFIGSWKCEMAKDTVYYQDIKAFGTGLEFNDKTVVKGKIISEEKELYGYDSKLDKLVGVDIVKDNTTAIPAMWFTSNSKLVVMYFTDITNPDKASWKNEVEFKSPNNVVANIFVNGKFIKTFNVKRVK